MWQLHMKQILSEFCQKIEETVKHYKADEKCPLWKFPNKNIRFQNGKCYTFLQVIQWKGNLYCPNNANTSPQIKLHVARWGDGEGHRERQRERERERERQTARTGMMARKLIRQSHSNVG